MRTLFLIRHAKSSWNEPGLEDSKRPLNKRGKDDAPKIGKVLKQKGASPDLIISSPAKRAFSTAKRIAKVLEYSKKDIIKDKALYMADIEDFMSVIQNTPNSVYSLMLFSHNYGITYFTNYISGSNIDNIPTCGAVRIDFDLETWHQIQNKKGKLVYFEYPKKYTEGI